MSSKPRVLLTGATGFIGSELASRLLREYEVWALERYVTGRYVLGQSRQISTVFADIREFMTVRSTLRDASPDYVIHLAALSPVAYSYGHPQEVVETNLLGTVNLAEAALRECPNLKQFLFASTSETYGVGKEVRTESAPSKPNSPYAVSKVAAEKYLQYLFEAHGFPATILRPFNTYGRKSNNHFVVERAVTQMIRGGPVLLGDPAPVRDMLYVDDHVNAYLSCLGRKEAIGEAFNFCTGRGVTIKQLVEIISKIAGYTGEVNWGTIPKRPLDIAYLVGDYSKAQRALGWSPRYSLEEGIKLTIDYWRAHGHTAQ